jgi:hypothetical protein
MQPPFTVIVNTSDAYSDCWVPFFTLFRTFWPGCRARVLLNTERAVFDFPGVTIESVRSAHGKHNQARWSDSLMRCLGLVETPLVLYLQEDYFLEDFVDASSIQSLAEVMVARPSIGHVGLTSFGARGPFTATDDSRLWNIAPRSRYRISTQAGFWRTGILESYLLPNENGWMFEIFGTWRSWRRPDTFLTVNRDLFADAPIVPYSPAGIVKGRWHPSVPALFARHGLLVDFDSRGFFHRKPALMEKISTARRLASDPGHLVRQLLAR